MTGITPLATDKTYTYDPGQKTLTVATFEKAERRLIDTKVFSDMEVKDISSRIAEFEDKSPSKFNYPSVRSLLWYGTVGLYFVAAIAFFSSDRERIKTLDLESFEYTARYFMRYTLLMLPFAYFDLTMRQYNIVKSGITIPALLVYTMYKYFEASTTILSEEFFDDFISTPLMRYMHLRGNSGG